MVQAMNTFLTKMNAIHSQMSHRALISLYRDVLDDGLKIEVAFMYGGKGINYALRTYKEHGWWIFKTKEMIHLYTLRPSGYITQSQIIKKGF